MAEENRAFLELPAGVCSSVTLRGDIRRTALSVLTTRCSSCWAPFQPDCGRLTLAGWHGDNPGFMNVPQVTGKSDVVALTPDVSVVSILALLLSVLLLSLGLLLGSTPAAG